MIAERKSSLIWLVLLIVLVFVYQTFSAIYTAAGLEPRPCFEFVFRAAFVCGVVWWLRAEAKDSGVTTLYCQGLLVALGWIFIIPYYLFKARGITGLLPFLALLGSFVLSTIFAAVIDVVFSGQF